MKKYKYIGLFISHDNTNKYELTVHCKGFIQAFFLLTAKAIESGKHYQLNKITDESGDIRMVDSIIKCGELLN